ncbi:MAG: acetate/propionate family kinase [Candidatus Nanoarchaeia archaeon]
MKILTINVGSSSVKYALYENKKKGCYGNIDRIGVKKGLTYKKAFSLLLSHLLESSIKSLNDIDAVAHRVVHAGQIQEHIRITSKTLKAIKDTRELAPLHDVPELKGIEICLKRLKCPQFALLDTAFHKPIPPKAYTYAIPDSLSNKFKIKRYGFHGLSYHYISKQVKSKKLIVCHLGNGASIAAIRNNKSVDTSMGFTPLEGLVMGSRSGDLDPGIIMFLQHHKKMGYKDLMFLLNKKSGLKGLSGFSDMRDLMKSRTKESKLARSIFCYRAAKYIGSYAATMNGVDTIVFTAGIGENEHSIRKEICSYLTHLGVKLDPNKNKKNNRLISKGKVKVLVIKTDEESIMATKTMRLLRNLKS